MLHRIKIDKNHVLLLIVVLAWTSFLILPEVFQDRIDPWDGSLFAANGALFLSVVQELGVFISNPVDWLWAYYNQYPTLTVRRHPPLFGITEMFVYIFTGVSVFGAKLTVFLYSLMLVLGVYALGCRLWQDKLLAAATSIFIISIPYVTAFSKTVRLDIPALAFAVWAMFHYVGYSKNDSRSSLLLFVILMVFSIYTYQLTVFFGIGAAIHLLFVKKKGDALRDRTIWLAVTITIILLIPLITQQIYMAQDQLATLMGDSPEKWKAFVPTTNKLSLEYWFYYPTALIKQYPIQAIGLVIWMVLVIRRGITQQEILFALCGFAALMYFSWAPGKGPRYALYFVIPWVFLIVFAIRDVATLLIREHKQAISMLSAGSILILSIFQVVVLPKKYLEYLIGMQEPTTNIISTMPSAKILYTGPRDAAFGFYIRQYDTKRKTRLYRATAQAEDPTNIEGFIQSNDVNVIVIESGDANSSREPYRSFVFYINKFLETHSEYKYSSSYYPYFEPQGRDPDKVKGIKLDVYIRGATPDSITVQ